MKDRNILTKKDIEELARIRTTADPSDVPVPTMDDYFDRLLKYVPVEIMGLYLVIEGLLKSMYDGPTINYYLLGLLIVGAFFTFWYVKRYLKVVRVFQVLMSVLAFLIWVFSMGGWFETQGFWQAGWGAIAVVIFAVTIKILRLPRLPDETLKNIK